MSERHYIVSLNRGVDYAAFNQEMIAVTGSGLIPNRNVEIANARPGSQRITHYNLTDAEAEALRNDSRVFGVDLLPSLDPSIGIGARAIQTGDFTKTTLDRGDFLNWGMRRINEAANPYTDLTVAGGYNYTLDGTGVDVVIMDSGLQADHPEFQDANGVSRVQQIDWFTASGLAGTQSANFYRDYDGHGTHVAGTVAGKTYGWAKNARIYSMKLAGLEGEGDSGTGIAIEPLSGNGAFDVITAWHNLKPVDPATGVKRPTIVNMSWGYIRYYNTVINLTYRGILKTGTDIDTPAKRWAFGLVPVSGGTSGTYAMNLRVPATDTALQEMIDAGIHVTIAAGNRYHKIDVPGGDDFANFVAADTGSNEYHKGSSPMDTEAHIVGNIDSTVHTGGLEQKAASSECGPGVSVYAPGTDIMSAMSTTNEFGANVANNPYPADDNFLINNISGTSMAAPQVAGVLALWLQINPSATPAQSLAFVSATAKTAQIYETGSAVDYTDTRSLLGSTNRFAFNKFNSNVQLRIGN
jgi:subtilisin family serine protease